jgi:hypothetical protein
MKLKWGTSNSNQLDQSNHLAKQQQQQQQEQQVFRLGFVVPFAKPHSSSSAKMLCQNHFAEPKLL